MIALALIHELQTLGIELWETDGELRFRAPRGVLTDDLKARLKCHKAAVLAKLNECQTALIEPDPAAALEPFPLTDIQSAYLIGRSSVLPYGGVPCQAYLEMELDQLKVECFEEAFNLAIKAHPALRTRIFPQGYQEVQPASPCTSIKVHHLDANSDLAIHCQCIRDSMVEANRLRDVSDWQLMKVEITCLPAGYLLHVLVDLLMADFVSVDLVLNQVIATANGESEGPQATTISFRDLVVSQQKQRQGNAYHKARLYWLARIPHLPPAPELPILPSANPFAAVDNRAFLRKTYVMSDANRTAFLANARQHGMTASVALLTGYAEVLRRWSRRAEFTLNITMMNRPSVHPDIHHVVGDFTSTLLLEIQAGSGKNFAERAQAIQQTLWQDLEHNSVSGVAVLRELARQKDRDAAMMPIVFTSTVGASDVQTKATMRLRDGITWTPQVWLDCQILETHGRIYVNWDYRQGVIPESALEAMFSSYVMLLESLAKSPDYWLKHRGVQPIAARQRELPLSSPYHGNLLHDGFLKAVRQWPERTAVADSATCLSYQQLYSAACRLAQQIDDACAGNLVAVIMDKGAAQIIAVLAIVLSGRAYVPIDSTQPKARKLLILEDACVDLILTQTWLAESEQYPGIKQQVVETHAQEANHYNPPSIAACSRAYLIYTSGTTGKPKGVVMSHQATANTVADINARIQLKPDDVVFGLANLSFDLSVYDIFGTLAAGAKIVLPAPELRANPGHWYELIRKHRISIWNSVPAQALMLYQYIESLPEADLGSLRIMMLSGDWVPVNLASNMTAINLDLSVISLGGATEAAIWSIWHPIVPEDSQRSSVPYGLPLTGQDVHVLNAEEDECPVGVIGDITISGFGLADCYFNDSVATDRSFFIHPLSQQRMYRTGDLGRYLLNGEIEFCGREDEQIKIRGHRVELGEIASVLESHPAVSAGAVVFSRKDDRQHTDLLAAFVVPERLDEIGINRRRQQGEHLHKLLRQHAEQLSGSIDTVALVELTKKLDDAARTAIVDLILTTVGPDSWTQAELCRVLTCPDHYQRLVRRWIVALLGSGHLNAEGPDCYRLNSRTLAEHAHGVEHDWEQVYVLAEGVSYPRVLLEYFKTSTERLAVQIVGGIDPVELFFPGGSEAIAMAAFRHNPSAMVCNQLAAEAVADLCESLIVEGNACRILEVGAGVGGLTGPVLDRLGDRDYSYILTDISKFYLVDAATKYAHNPRLRTARLDILQDLPAQGFEASQFDVLLCGDLLHAVADIPRALRNLSSLLSPGGWLVLLEATEERLEALTSLELMLPLKDSGGKFLDTRDVDGRAFLNAEEWLQILNTEGWTVSAPFPGGALGAIGLQMFVAQNRVGVASFRADELESYLSERLPSYMLPQQLHLVESLPLSSNGKVDRKKLLAQLHRPTGDNGRVIVESLQTDTERTMAKLWGDALDCEIVDRSVGFFELGGDSLIAARLAGRIDDSQSTSTQLHFDEVLRLLMEGLPLGEFVKRLSENRSKVTLADRHAENGTTTSAGDVSVKRPAEVSLRQGIGSQSRLFVVVATEKLVLDERTVETSVNPDAAYLEDIAAELGVLGAVAQVGITPGFAMEAEPNQVLSNWLEDVIEQLPMADRNEISVIGTGADAYLCIELARRLSLRSTTAMLRCQLLYPCSPSDQSGIAYSLQQAALLDEPFSFDLSLIVENENKNSTVENIEYLCLGQVDLYVQCQDKIEVDIILGWLESEPCGVFSS